MYNKKLVNDLYNRKLFKTHIFHRDNTDDEEYYWDDYDIKNYHTNNPKQPKSSMYLPRPSVQIIKTNIPNEPKSNKSTQTLPKFYLPNHRFNLNIEPFNTSI